MRRGIRSWSGAASALLVLALAWLSAACPAAIDWSELRLADGGLPASPETSALSDSGAGAPVDGGAGAPVCLEGRGDCNGRADDRCEVDLTSDADHCGRCGRACEADRVCSRGECVATCDEGLERCGRDCVDVKVHAKHCGGCDTPCTGTDVCRSGVCAACVPRCDGKACGEDDGCGNRCTTGACAAGLRCAGGACVCDATSCQGCCSSATKCESGTEHRACGAGGAACTACPLDRSCFEHTCRDVTISCVYNANRQAEVASCREECLRSGKSCTAGIDVVDRTAVGYIARGLACDYAQVVARHASCASDVLVNPGHSLGCYCLGP